MPVPEILLFDPSVHARREDITQTLLEVYLPPALFALDVTRTGERTFGARYIVQRIHCDPLTTPRVRGEIQRTGERITNILVVDAEDLEGRPPHTIGHIIGRPIFPGNLGIATVMEAAGFDQPMDLLEVGAWNFKGPGLPKDLLVATADIFSDQPNRREFKEATVRIGGREHLVGTDLVFAPSLSHGCIYLPQFRQYEIVAQMAGGGLPTLVGPILGGEIAAIYDSVWTTVHVPDLTEPGAELRGEIELYDLSELTHDGLLGEFDARLFNGQKVIFDGKGITLAFYPKRQIQSFIDAALGEAP